MLRAFFVGLLFVSSFAQAKVSPLRKPLHLDLQATSAEYERARANQPHFFAAPLSAEDRELERIVQIGKRNLDWLKFMNTDRPEPLKFTKPGSLTGIPITKPQLYSGKTTIAKFNDYVSKLPDEMRAILIDGKEFTHDPPIAVEDYQKLGNEMDKIYQTAIRWQMMQPYLGYLTQARQEDIRGYYFLKDEKNLQADLAQWSSLDEARRTQLREWLLGQCYNKEESDATCAGGFDRAVQANALWDFHQQYVANAKELFDGFFELQNARHDLTWNQAQPEVALFPMQIPGIQAIQDFLRVNLEDEWKWNGWQLKFDFVPQALTHVIFQEGVTPHVNGLGGNEIYMDANSPLTEWDVQWTIRHEFGHVLGFPDCYVEFYDPAQQVIIDYQIDITNLMCARSGRMNQGMFEELKKNYLAK